MNTADPSSIAHYWTSIKLRIALVLIGYSTILIEDIAVRQLVNLFANQFYVDNVYLGNSIIKTDSIGTKYFPVDSMHTSLQLFSESQSATLA